jgi:maleylacetoacetate isomerase
MAAHPTLLYQYWRSSASWRVRWALLRKRIPFERITVEIGPGVQPSAEHLQRNPMGRVPVLYIDGKSLAESVAIIEYLEETRPEPALYPRDPLARARVRQIIETVNAGVQPFQNSAALARVGADVAAQKAYAKHFNQRGLEVLESLCEQFAHERGAAAAPFSMGTQPGAMELFVVPQVASARQFGVDVGKYPRLLGMEAAALATETGRAALPELQPGAPGR